MEYPNSILIPPSSYDTTMDGLSSPIPLRVHRTPDLADRGAFRAKRDWQHLFGSLPDTSTSYAGIMGPEHNFVATCMPETLPDRLELVAYVTEIVFLMDDMIDSAGSPASVASRYLGDFLQAYNAVMAGGEVQDGSGSPVVKILVDVGRAMLEVDAEGAKTALAWLRKWSALVLSRPDAGKECRDLDGYLEYRRVNIASEAAFGLLMFAMGLRIPEDQQQTCFELSRPFWMQTALANDCHSWERERRTAGSQDAGFVANAIWVLMHRQSMTLEEAKTVCRARAKEYAAEYLQVVESASGRDDLCRDAKFFLDALQFGISGNIAWGLQCPRYHVERKLTPAQCEMGKTVRADQAIGWHHVQICVKKGVGRHSAVKTNGAVVNGVHRQAVAVVRDVPALGMEALEAPSRYLDAMPGKGIRDKAIDTLNSRFKLPADQIIAIKKVVNLLHGASLMLDDIQDSSQLRRGKPAAHMVFGTMQTINTAGYRFLGALSEVMSLGSEKCLEVFRDELRNLYVGQSHDLSWTCNLECPTETEYLAMVDNKTAGLFRMLGRLMDAKSDSPEKPDIKLLTRFMSLLGRLFQIRDDYMNLTSADYTEQKGFCEDLDEGKYSLPVIHALGRCADDGLEATATGVNHATVQVLCNLLAQRHAVGRMSLDQKKLFLEHLEKRGSLEYTRCALDALQDELEGLAEQMGMLKDDRIKELLDSLRVRK